MAPVAHVDLFPTLAELANVTKPNNLQGQSLVSMLKDPTRTGRGWAITQVTRGAAKERFYGYSLRTAQWRYTEWDSGAKGRELYDHQSDPNELHNLADSAPHKVTVEELSQRLHEAIQSTFPANGRTPELKGNWAPNLTDVD